MQRVQSDERPDWSKIRLQPRNTHKLEKKRIYRKGRDVNSVQYAIAWGVLNKIQYRDDLLRLSRNVDAPSYVWIIKQWKSFSNYYLALLKAGMQPRPPRSEAARRRFFDMQKGKMVFKLIRDDFEICKRIAELGILDRTAYRKYRKDHPEMKRILPNDNVLSQRFGSWELVRYEAQKYNVDALITRYVQQSAKAGHWLYLKECDKIKLDIRHAMKMLRPRLFNIFCYRKLELLGLTGTVPNPQGEKNEK